mmetsp:Transcript_771/g.1375  ORF Transcript_771/g.1375 Transcript_771/m.1375 type:complete len:84 (+) Transcript_771:1512-1763(+)
MRNLNEKLSQRPGGQSAGSFLSQSVQGGGVDFQAYLMREKQDYLRSVGQFEKEAPMIQSLSNFKGQGGLPLPPQQHQQFLSAN